MSRVKIKEARNSLKITQKELAIKIGISQSFLSEIENGKYDISLSLFYNIANALDMCPYELIDACNNCTKDCNKKFFYP